MTKKKAKSKSKTKPKTKSKTKKSDIVLDSIKAVKKDTPDWEWKEWDESDWYGALESEIDGRMYEEKYQHVRNQFDLEYDKYTCDWNDNSEYEIVLERLVFDGIKQVTKKHHQCDPYYDDAFDGGDGY